MNVKAAAKGITAIVVTIAAASILISSMMGAPAVKNDAQADDGLTTGPQKSVWDGTIDAVVANDGVFRIENAAQLAWLAASTNDGSMHSFAGSRIELVNDIDLDNKEWTPIGTSAQPFSGTFEGNGHIISNIHCSDASSDYVGLFGYTDGGKIADLNIGKVDLVGNEYVAGLAGYLGSETSNVTVTGEESTLGKITGHRYIGGIAGYLGMNVDHATVSYTDITGTRVHESETYDFTDEGDDVGGIAGFTNASIQNCKVSDSNIIAYRNAGGITGNIQQSGGSNIAIDGAVTERVRITIDHTGITDPLESTDTHAGKIYGRMIGDSTVQNTTSIETTITLINCDTQLSEHVTAETIENLDNIQNITTVDNDKAMVLNNANIISTTGPVIDIEPGHTVTLIIKGNCRIESTITDAIRVPATSTLIIKGFDENSSLTVKAATVNSNSNHGSGIGYQDHSTGDITIIGLDNLSVTARGLKAYGIGGNGSTVSIIDTHITEVIGGSRHDDWSMNSTNVNAWGSGNDQGGPAIGGSCIVIESSVIDLAVGGPKAAGIGAIMYQGVSIKIEDSTIGSAYGGSSSAGIGGSRHDDGTGTPKVYTGQPVSIHIENSNIGAIGGDNGAGIGSGYDSHCLRQQSECEIIITSYSKISAQGGKYAAGIGTGYHYARLSGYIDSTVDITDVHGSVTLKNKTGYSEAQDIGYGSVGFNLIDSQHLESQQLTVDHDITFTVNGELIPMPEGIIQP